MKDSMSVAKMRLTPLAVTKPPATKPPVAVSPILTLAISTANIQNFNPDLTRVQVRADVAKVGKISQLILFQEIGEPTDVTDLETTLEKLDKSWFATKSGGTGARSNVIAWKQSFPLVAKGGVHVVKIGNGIPNAYTPDQYLTIKEFSFPGFPTIEVHCLHYIQGAFSKPGQPGDADGTRIRTWNANYAAHKRLVLEAQRKGHVVIYGGDWNRPLKDIPKMHPLQQWIVEGPNGIDGVACIVPATITLAKAGTTKATSLNSDHNAKTRTVVFRVK
jgi:hypothetical protein